MQRQPSGYFLFSASSPHLLACYLIFVSSLSILSTLLYQYHLLIALSLFECNFPSLAQYFSSHESSRFLQCGIEKGFYSILFYRLPSETPHAHPLDGQVLISAAVNAPSGSSVPTKTSFLQLFQRLRKGLFDWPARQCGRGLRLCSRLHHTLHILLKLHRTKQKHRDVSALCDITQGRLSERPVWKSGVSITPWSQSVKLGQSLNIDIY